MPHARATLSGPSSSHRAEGCKEFAIQCFPMFNKYYKAESLLTNCSSYSTSLTQATGRDLASEKAQGRTQARHNGQLGTRPYRMVGKLSRVWFSKPGARCRRGASHPD